MKKKVFGSALFLLICFTVSVQAQGGYGGGSGMRGGGMGGGGRQHHQGERSQAKSAYSSNGNSQIIITYMPEIPGLSLDNHIKLTDALVKQRQEVSLLMNQKFAIEEKMNQTPNMSPKEVEKQNAKIKELEKKAKEVNAKYEEKMRKALTTEQYQIFADKRNEIKFSDADRRRFNDGNVDRSERHEAAPRLGDDQSGF